MDPERWQRIEALLHSALALDTSERESFLARACDGDEVLRREVDSLLAHELDADGFLQGLAIETAADEIRIHEAHAASSQPSATPTHVSRYRIHDKLGEGGMGVVYVAEDERLGRRVALKLLRNDSADPAARMRLVREARLAAAISHPLVCQVFELDEWKGQPFIAMELIAGMPLAARLSGTALPPAEALGIAISIVEALSVLHRHGVIHRDLKPSNIFVTDSGIKVLDFGVSRSLDSSLSDTGGNLTAAGMFVGTPQYASPEQLAGAAIDTRSDLFSAGVILFEMLVGRPPFSGATLASLAHSVLYEAAPVLTGSPAITAIDRILHRALAKDPGDRYATADAFAADLREVVPLVENGRTIEARPLLRLAVLPFRLLKPDPDIDYLGTSLADALISSLLGFESLVVRSSLKSSQYAGSVPDLNKVAADLAVDVVLTGSILRIQDRVRVNAELVSVPAGDIWWKQTTQVPFDAVFDLHDDLARRVAASLPLTSRDHARQPGGGTRNAKAFDLYLRGMQLRMETSNWPTARAFFDQALEIDPGFAAAWAERGRLNRVLGKYGSPGEFARAEIALRRALELDADLGAAQYYYAQLEIDLGRPEEALDRLLARADQRRAEPHIYAALVHACRYAGLLDESVEANRLARRLDPAVPTSVLHTYYMQGDFTRALEAAHQSSDPFEARVLAAMGREQEAMAVARREEGRFATVPMLRAFSTALRAALEGNRNEAVAALRTFEGNAFSDGEGLFYVAEIYAKLGDREQAHTMLSRAVDAGFVCRAAFERDPFLSSLHAGERWNALLQQVRLQQHAIAGRFQDKLQAVFGPTG